MKRSTSFVILIGLLAAATCLPTPSICYTIKDLGTLPGDAGTPVFMNSTGQAAGFRGHSPYQGFVYTPHSGTVNLAPLSGDSDSDATGINDLGQVVGISYVGNGGRVYVYTPGVGVSRIAALGDTVYYATINNVGQIGGYDKIGAFVYTPGSGVNRPIGGGGIVWALNDIGYAVGCMGYGGFIYVPRSGTRYLGDDVTPYAVNYWGQVVGQRGDGWDSHAFVYTWATGNMLDLGTLPGMSGSTANDINYEGVVVGSSSISGFGKAFVCVPGSQMVALPSLTAKGWAEALYINDAGRIYGLASGPGGTHVVMWTIPEPSSLLALLAGLGGLGGMAWRRRR